jgi:hypothetical protein
MPKHATHQLSPVHTQQDLKSSSIRGTYKILQIAARFKLISPVAQVEDPSKYGVVVTDDSGKVERFVEKPKVRECLLGPSTWK